MNFTFATLLLSIFLLGPVSFAADQNQAYDLICKPMLFSSEKASCTNIIRKHSYFHNEALQMCAEANFDSDKMRCLDGIGNKSYMNFEITECKNETFDSQKISCLLNSGSQGSGNADCKLNSVTEQKFKSMLFDLRSGNYRAVDNNLLQLIEQSKNCLN
jgi:hypothetical protein